LVKGARRQVAAYFKLNPVLRRPVPLQLPAKDTDNPYEGDIVFAHLDTPRDKNLVNVDLTDPVALGTTNSVRVFARRTKARKAGVPLFGSTFLKAISSDVIARATATLDRYVIGIRPVGLHQPAPLVPIALFSDPFFRSAPGSWEQQTTPPFIDQYA